MAAAANAGSLTIRAVIQQLSAANSAQMYFYPFSAALILVDLAQHVLTSTKIRGAIHAGDPHFVLRDDPESFEQWFDYSIADEFVDDEIASPTAYIADRLARKFLNGERGTTESDTVRMFLACASHVNSEEKHGDPE
jgi:hypothetical protein